MIAAQSVQVTARSQPIQLDGRLRPEARQRGREAIGASREVRRDQVVADPGQPQQALGAELLDDMLAQALEQPHIAAAILEGDQVRHAAG